MYKGSQRAHKTINPSLGGSRFTTTLCQSISFTKHPRLPLLEIRDQAIYSSTSFNKSKH